MSKNLNVFSAAYGLLINGEWTKPGDLLESVNPANGQLLAKFTDATEADVNAAVAAAQEAFKSWKKTTAAERANILIKIAEVIEENLELFALQETLDNGKPIRETRAADIALSADHFRYFAGVIRGEEGTANQLDEEDLSIVLREPIGVVGQIIPFPHGCLENRARTCRRLHHRYPSLLQHLTQPVVIRRENQPFTPERRAEYYHWSWQ